MAFPALEASSASVAAPCELNNPVLGPESSAITSLSDITIGRRPFPRERMVTFSRASVLSIKIATGALLSVAVAITRTEGVASVDVVTSVVAKDEGLGVEGTGSPSQIGSA
ncbi:hypothetical protein Aduo_017164 [Ancylostoma duodenale]